MSGILTNASGQPLRTWSGREGNITFKDITDYLYNFKTDNINVKGSAENFAVRFLTPHGYCKTFKLKTDTYIVVNFETGEQDAIEGHGESYYIFIYDNNLSTQFQVPYHFITGDNIIMEMKNYAQYREYNIQLKETKVETDDGSCENYPFGAYNTHSGCIDAELEGKVLPILGCMVPWMSEKNSCVGQIYPQTGVNHFRFYNR